MPTDTLSSTAVEFDIAAAVNAVFAEHFDVVVHNDDVTTFDTVITALVSLFGHTAQRAEELAWEVHRSGEAVVATLPEPEAAEGVIGLHGFKIRASMRPAGS